jgi:4a-hydroxytetrahydrobiopterin dehydratase
MAVLDDDAIAQGLQGSEWRHEEGVLSREYKFRNFTEALSFVNRVAETAEEANHHPDILIHGWNNVRLMLSTHSEGGVTQADLDMSERLSSLGS